MPRRLAREYGLTTDRGLAVTAVSHGSPAARAGVAAGDLIVDFDGVPVGGADDLHRLLTEERIDRAAWLRLLRAGAERRVEVVPSELG